MHIGFRPFTRTIDVASTIHSHPFPKEISVKLMARLCMVTLVASFLAANVAAAMAQETGKSAEGVKGQATRTVLAENDRIQVFEIRQKPGEISNPNTSGTRVIRALQGGTLQRTYADGKTKSRYGKPARCKFRNPVRNTR